MAQVLAKQKNKNFLKNFQLIDARQLAVLLSCSVREVYRLSSAGTLPKCQKIGGRKKWRLGDIEKFLDKKFSKSQNSSSGSKVLVKAVRQ